MKIIKFFIFFQVLLFICACSTINAQENNSLLLKITDQNGGIIEKAAIAIKDENGKELKEIFHFKNGSFQSSLTNIGNHTIEILAEGFRLFSKPIVVKKGQNFYEIVLEVALIKESISIELSPREKRFNDAINRVFSQEEINNLPDNPEEIKQELQRRYGSDVVIKVNGFTGGQFPDKSQIASISVIISPIDAEFREVGKTVVNVTTRVSKSKDWTGFLSLDFSDSALNARNAFAPRKQPFHNQNYFVWLNPSTIGKNTSVSFSLFGSNNMEEKLFLGNGLDIINFEDRNSRNLNISPSITLNQNINSQNSLYVKYSVYYDRGSKQGLGAFDFSERAFSSQNISNNLRIANSTNWKKYNNQIRFEITKSNLRSIPLNSEPAVIVLGNFNKGGAGNKSEFGIHKYNLTNTLSSHNGNHQIKIGGEVEFEKRQYESSENINGTFTFSSLSEYLNNTPILFEKRKNVASAGFSQINTSFFFQDYFSISQNLQIGLGGRWDFQNKVRDYNNFAPRLSLVWSPEKTGRLILRSGFGSLFNYINTSFFSSVLSNDGRQSEELRILNPSFPNLYLSDTDSLLVEKPGISKLDVLKNPTLYVSFLGATYTPFDRLKVRTTFISIRGNYLTRIRDINYYENGVRPNTELGMIRLYESSGNLSVNSLVIHSELKLKGFDITSEYSFFKTLVDFNESGLPTDNTNLKADMAPADDEKRHSFNITSSFTPFRFIRYNPLHNVNIYLTFSTKSGKPYTITTGNDNNNDGIINDRPLGVKRNSEREAWLNKTDLRINWKPVFMKKDGKNIPYLNKANISVTVQNLFNQTNEQNFVGIQTSPFFRQATSAAPARTIQFGLSWMF